jgi:hypothetical protein
LRALSALALGEILMPREDKVVVGLLDDLQRMMSDPVPAVQRAAAAAIVNVWSRKS